MTKLAPAASGKLEKEYSARPIQPGQWFPPRTIDFMIATVGTPFPTNLNHHNPISAAGPSMLSVSVLDLCHLSFAVFGAAARIQRLLLVAIPTLGDPLYGLLSG